MRKAETGMVQKQIEAFILWLGTMPHPNQQAYRNWRHAISEQNFETRHNEK
jgi:hypothetical protein